VVRWSAVGLWGFGGGSDVATVPGCLAVCAATPASWRRSGEAQARAPGIGTRTSQRMGFSPCPPACLSPAWVVDHGSCFMQAHVYTHRIRPRIQPTSQMRQVADRIRPLFERLTSCTVLRLQGPNRHFRRARKEKFEALKQWPFWRVLDAISADGTES